MADAEIVVTEASMLSYTSCDNSAVYDDAVLNVTPDSNSLALEGNKDFSFPLKTDAAYSVPLFHNLAGQSNKTDSTSVQGGVHAGPTFETVPMVAQGCTRESGSTIEDEYISPAEAVNYDSIVNGNMDCTGGNKTSTENCDADLEGGHSSEQHFLHLSVDAMSNEEDRLWRVVRNNSLDFDAWTALLDETEKVAGENILKIRNVYDAFLAEFPLCYGYWKKYADHEARLDAMDKVVEVYERAVLGVTYSVDIWLHYCMFAIHSCGDPDSIRRLFERGLAYVGTDYLCCPLWDKYIEYEELHGEWARVAMIYTKILEIPNRRLDDYLHRFKAFASSRPLSELKIAGETCTEISEGQQEAAEQFYNPQGAEVTDAELEKYIAVREEVHRKAKELDCKLSDFENSIRRPYFHMRPLNVAELENWHNYLDFMEAEGELNKVVKLYERCLIACANYPEYWIRYILCMEFWGSMDLADNALARATQVFVKRQPEIHLFAAQFREQNGDIPGAQAAYQLIHTEIAPGLLEAIIKHANMEKRLGNLDHAFSLYEQAIAIEKGKDHSEVLPMLFAQYSRFLYLVSGNAEKARKILIGALENVQLSKPIIEALIHLESIHSLPRQLDYLDMLVDKFLIPSSDSECMAIAADREQLSCIFLEFIGIFGDVQSIKKANDRHAKLFSPHRSRLDIKKRHAEDYHTSDKAKVAKPYSDATSSSSSSSSSTISVMGAYPSAQTQWASTGYGSFGLQAQVWPPVTQPQVQQQQWPPAAYAQQAMYGGYVGYGSSYPNNPQAPTSTAQPASYVSYPPAYAVQAYPQQTHALSSATAPLASSQQLPPASLPQPSYYATFYQ